MTYRMIFSDMDGTLLKNDMEISEKNITTIKKATQKGVEFVICTGRGVYGVERFLKQLDLLGKKGYVICQNGAAVYDLENMNMVVKHAFSADELRPVVEAARRLGVDIYLYDDRTFLTEKVTTEAKNYCKVMGADMRILEDGLSYEGHFTKCLLSAKPALLEQLRSEIAPLTTETFNIFYSGPYYLEVVKKGVSKGNALAETAKKAGVPLSEVIAVGDSENDLSMIQKAGLGIAVGNAVEDVKNAANVVLQETYAEDAVATLIEKFVL